MSSITVQQGGAELVTRAAAAALVLYFTGFAHSLKNAAYIGSLCSVASIVSEEVIEGNAQTPLGQARSADLSAAGAAGELLYRTIAGTILVYAGGAEKTAWPAVKAGFLGAGIASIASEQILEGPVYGYPVPKMKGSAASS